MSEKLILHESEVKKVNKLKINPKEIRRLAEKGKMCFAKVYNYPTFAILIGHKT
ncbi:hypothetical protein SAMN04489723_1266 [Algoriphagus aquimarinus]|uniref:Uncharacterized protein n=1 Tax=Algoriphagus aquimarinus TaxID=237018 RepID=A0A1I1CF54_9BACT|nr:hypothetical protein SAMN04489723_1266 [Algoriphagus aquimarinus]